MRSKTLIETVALLILSSISVCCTVGPDYEPPTLDLPEEWTAPREGLALGEPETLARWWELFDDPTLTRLIEAASTRNRDLQQALARVAEARALTGVARGEPLPQVAASGRYTRERASKNAASEAAGTGDEFNSLNWGVDASWEIDVFGRIRRSIEAAEGEWGATVEDYRDFSVILFADIARFYIEARILQARLAVARRNLDIQRSARELAQARFEADLVSELDPAQARQILADTEATVPNLEEAYFRSLHRLCVLIGESPGTLRESLGDGGAIPTIPSGLLVGTPAEIILQRPDVRRAERELAAQTARVGVAVADLYPRFSILGSFGFESDGVRDLADASSRGFRMGPAMRWNLFTGGRIRSLIEAEDARLEGALVAYEQAVLLALEEAENAIVGVVRERIRVASLREAAEAARRSADLSTELYRSGLVSYQRVIDAQRARLAAEDDLVSSRGRNAQNVVALYRAFGGGWEGGQEMLVSYRQDPIQKQGPP